MIHGLGRTLLLSVLACASLLAATGGLRLGASPAFACVDQGSACTYSNLAVTSVTSDAYNYYYHAQITVSDTTSDVQVQGAVCADQAQTNCGAPAPCTMQSGTTYQCDQSGIGKGALTPGRTAYYVFCTVNATNAASDCPVGSGSLPFTVPGNPTVAVASHVNVSHLHGKTYLRWYSAVRVLGFNVFDGSAKLNHRIVTSATHWYRFSTSGRIAHLHLQAIQEPIHQ